MAVSTISSALGVSYGLNEESNKVIAFMSWNRTAEQMIQEYFWLRKQVVYSDDGKEAIDMINEFRDPIKLKQKKVHYNEYFRSKWLTEDMFYKLVPRDFVYVEPIAPVIEPTITLTTDDKDTTSTWITETKPVVRRPRGRAKKNTK